MRTLSAALLAGLLALGASASSATRDFVSDHLAGPPVLVHGTGAAGTMKIVFLGDGFTSVDVSMDAYRTAVDQAVTALLAMDPFQAMSAALSIYRVDVISDEAGIDVPVACPEDSTDPHAQFDMPPPPPDPNGPYSFSRRPKTPNNALETHWCAYGVMAKRNIKRLLNVDGTRLQDFRMYLEGAGISPDMTIVLVNDWMFGATAWREPEGLVFASIGQNLTGEQNPDTGVAHPSLKPDVIAGVVVHEIGHLKPFALLDEYFNGRGRPAEELPDEKGTIDISPNLSTELSPAKWAHLGSTGTLTDCETETNPPEVSAVPGGYGFAADVYHSRCTCRMNDSYAGSFCVVCRDQIFRGLASHLPLRDYDPARREPTPWWMFVDSVELMSAPPGMYSVQYKVTDGRKTFAGTWPQARTAVFLRRGEVVEVGEVLALIRGGLTSPKTVDVEYSLFLHSQITTRRAPTLVARETATVEVRKIRTGLTTVTRPAFRVTLGFVNR